MGSAKGGHQSRVVGQGRHPLSGEGLGIRTLSPLAWQTSAWSSSRSTSAVARVLGIC